MTRKEYNQAVQLYADNIYRFVLKNLRDAEQARDVVQDTYAKVWLKVDDIEFSKAKSYLFTTAYNTMIDLIRREERRRANMPLQQAGVAYNQFSDLQEVLSQALATLPQQQQSLVLLRDYEGYSYEEIGQITGLSESQVKVYIFRARQAMRNYIRSLDYVLEENHEHQAGKLRGLAARLH
ncbi:MAG: RNA polymerase sigma factor [Bacteroidetes bacterium]|nr:RNA polymerase sigma factor [Bacteroidota bacterium]